MPVPVLLCARVAELADARDLGSRVFDVGVQIPSLAPFLLFASTPKCRISA